MDHAAEAEIAGARRTSSARTSHEQLTKRRGAAIGRPPRSPYLDRLFTQASISASLPLPTTIMAILPSLFTIAIVGMPVTP
jgi:hypothetical protein